MEHEIMIRHTVESLYEVKRGVLHAVNEMRDNEKKIAKLYEQVDGYSPYQTRVNYIYNDKEDVQLIDKVCWKYLVKLYNLRAYMLCTEYDKMMRELEEYKAPEFSVDTALSWLLGLKELIYENVKGMVHRIFDNLMNGIYYTGNVKKKRNNSKIEKRFILLTYDYDSIYGYSNRNTITDDLEKICYLINGIKLPEKTLKQKMYENKEGIGENDYFKIKVCKNGNTHYELDDDIVVKLNTICADRNAIGDAIKIKVF